MPCSVFRSDSPSVFRDARTTMSNVCRFNQCRLRLPPTAAAMFLSQSLRDWHTPVLALRVSRSRIAQGTMSMQSMLKSDSQTPSDRRCQFIGSVKAPGCDRSDRSGKVHVCRGLPATSAGRHHILQVIPARPPARPPPGAMKRCAPSSPWPCARRARGSGPGPGPQLAPTQTIDSSDRRSSASAVVGAGGFVIVTEEDRRWCWPGGGHTR